MTKSDDALQRAEHAQELAKEAADLLKDSEVAPQSAAAADVDSQTGAAVEEQPSKESAKDSDITGPGAPMP